MSDRGSDPTEPIDELTPAAPGRRASSNVVGNAIAILLVLAIGALMAAGTLRSFVPPIRGATGASPSPTATGAVDPSFTLRPLPSFTPTPTATRSPSPAPSPTRTATPTARATPTRTATPRPPTPTPVRTPGPSPTR